METVQNLEEALREARMENGGTTLENIARIITKVLDGSETRALIRELTIRSATMETKEVTQF